ncbi:MAG: hypothetical protein HY842_14965 [Bacteroidetes bacterium]|nr:hypothetical protein [Bacteroidota bacterium]
MLNFQKVFRGGLTTLPFLFFTLILSAQPKDNAPYSRIGLGELANHSLSSVGFAGLSAAYIDPLHINLQNPASYAWLNAATFEVGMYAEHANLEFKGEKASIWTGNASHLALAFPMRNALNDVLSKKKRKVFWGMNLALLPNTSVGYDIETTEAIPEVDTTVNIYQGTGGTNKLLWGNAVRYKNFSGGVNIGYLFGQLESTRAVSFPNLPVSYQDIFKDNISVRGLLWSAGAQYQFNLEKKKTEEEVYTGKSLIVGAYGNTATNFNTRSTVLRIRDNPTYNQSDTLQFLEDDEGNGKLPAEWTLGFMYQNPGKLRVGAEYNFAGWSKYENEAKEETLYDSYRVAVGAEYIPDISSYNNYLKRIRYRAGFYHRTDPRLDDLTQTAFTLGVGLPVILARQKTSFVNVAVELGQYNTSDAIKESFVKIALGFTLNDNSWFFKRKFG